MLSFIFFVILIVLIIGVTIFLILTLCKNKKLHNEGKKLIGEKTKLETDIATLTLGINSLHDDINSKENLLSELNTEREENLKSIEQLKVNNIEISKILDEKSNELDQKNVELLKKTAELKDSEKKTRIIKRDLDDKKNKIDLIQCLLNSKKSLNEGVQNYLQLLTQDYYEFAKNNDSLADEANALLRLQNVAKDLDFLSSDKQLSNKTIIAIAGQFSSGKSSFLNSIFENNSVTLPTDLNQSTAINAYIMNNTTHSITAYTNSGDLSNIEQKQFDLFNYSEINYNNFNLKKIVNHFVINNSFVLPLNNICFIDTPGYNPGVYAEDDYTSAMTSIQNSNALIWCVAATNGTIQYDDIKLLYNFKTNNPNLKIYVIINKADLRSDEDNEYILQEIYNNVREIGVEGVCLYTSNELITEQGKYLDQHIGCEFLTFLESLNKLNHSKNQALIEQINSVFQDYICADKERIKNNKEKIEKIKKLNYILTSALDDKDNIILYLRARLHPAYLKESTVIKLDEELDGDSSDDDIIKNDKIADYIEIINGIQKELENNIKNDERDINIANDLSCKMQSCVYKAFS